MTTQEFLYVAEWLDDAQTFGKFARWNALEGNAVAAQNAAYAAAHALRKAHVIADVRYDDAPAESPLEAYPLELQFLGK